MLVYLQTHTGLIQGGQQQPNQDQNGPLYRATYQATQEYYNSQTSLSTGAIPRSSWHGDVPKSTQRTYQQAEEFTGSSQSVSVQIEAVKDAPKDGPKNSKTMTKTYHTIKDIISGRFKSNKESDDKGEDQGLNNMTEETRKSGRSMDELEKKTAGEQGIYGKPRTEQNMTLQQHHYNQHIIQQHIIAQQAMQAQQQYQASQQFKSQQHHPHHQQLAQARSQEMLAPKPEEQLYYQNSYGSAPQRPQNRYGVQQQSREQSFVPMQHSPVVSYHKM